MQTDPERVKSKSEKYPWRYPKEAFGKKDKAGSR
jgi:zona occludens toxin